MYKARQIIMKALNNYSTNLRIYSEWAIPTTLSISLASRRLDPWSMIIMPVTGSSSRDAALRNQVALLKRDDRSRQCNIKIFEKNNIETNSIVLLCRIVLLAQVYNIVAISFLEISGI